MLRRYYKTEVGRLAIDGVLLSMPLFGDLIKKVAIARFSRTFGTLIRAGVPMLTALDVVKDTADNAVIARAVDKVYTEVRQGGTISKPMSKTSIFPAMVTQMVAVGEETGKLDDMLSKVADFYDMEVENAVEALTSMLEPIMVVGIGGIVGSVVIGMYLPIFTVINQLK
jgi:type IV pilus assembly protein PilC